MWKKTVLLILICFLSSGRAFAQMETNPIEIWINEHPQSFSNDIYIDEQGLFFAPMAEFFQKMGIQYDVSYDGEIIAFRDNIFIKFRPHHTMYALNGKELNWIVPPRYHGTTLYVHMDPFVRYMDIRASWDAQTKRLDLSSGLLFEERRSRGLLKRVEIPASQISLSIPYFWERMELARFGLNPRVGVLIFDVTFEPTDPSAPIRQLIEEATDAFELPKNLTLMETRELLIGNITLYTKRYRGSPDATQVLLDATPPNIPYLSLSHFRIGDLFYSFIFQSELADIPSQIETELLIFESIHSKIFSLDTLSEHYVEYSLFNYLDVFIETPLYSNMMVDNSFPLKGSIDPDIHELDLTLMRQERSYQYTIHVKDGFFDEQIPVPFGLGFHRLILSAPAADIGKEARERLYLGESGTLLLKCSLVNINETQALYLSASREVLSHDIRIRQMASRIDSHEIDAKKALTLFRLLKEEYAVGGAEMMAQALDSKGGNAYTLNLLYTALLRASGVPARVVRDEETHLHYVEFYSNGRWVPTAPAAFVASEAEDEYPFFDIRGFDQMNTVPLDI